MGKSRECIDHTGVMFSNLTEMCKHYNISVREYNKRRRNGWSLKDSLTVSLVHQRKEDQISKQCYDHNGKVFKDLTEMCRYYNINKQTYNKRIKQGCSTEDALKNPINKRVGKECCDHKGRVFNNVTEMCNYYNISSLYYNRRRRAGLSIEESLNI